MKYVHVESQYHPGGISKFVFCIIDIKGNILDIQHQQSILVQNFGRIMNPQ